MNNVPAKKVVLYALTIFISFIVAAQRKQPKELGIGDKLPDIAINKLINYTKPELRLSDFQGKAMILDFWAPWCSPCIAAFPKLDSFQKTFSKDLQILPVTRESRDFSERVLKNMQDVKHIKPPVTVVEDTMLSKLFQHKILPHYVWIDSKGIVKAITGGNEVTHDNLQKLIAGMDLGFAVKRDNRVVDDDKPVFASHQVKITDELQYHSVITGYMQDVPIPSGSFYDKTWIHCTNHSIKSLYLLAFGNWRLEFLDPYNSRLILEGFDTNDSLMVGVYTKQTRPVWNEIKYNNLYNYELVVPDSTFTTVEKFELMQQDLNRFFTSKKIKGRLEKKTVKVLALQRTSTEDKLKATPGPAVDKHSNYYVNLKNQRLIVFVDMLNAFFKKEGALPVVNETDYRGKVDMEINANLEDRDAVNKELQKYDLKLVEKEKEIEMVVLTKIVKKSV